ncbi:hypothetical protein SAMN05421787_12726 [Virgibacillus pantothenticus]|nr:hypothetical protein SAMN05421787_12726 [Virgibacillus pantothenticus]
MTDSCDICNRCGSHNVEEKPQIIEYEDGTNEVYYDTQDAKCLDCGKEWLIIY